MLLIKDILVSDELLDQFFACDLDACEGACCWEGDYGAPLTLEERELLDDIYPDLRPYLSEAGKAVIDEVGTSVYYDLGQEHGTPLIDHRDCAYLTYDKDGIAQCGIEVAWRLGAVTFRKPISCHLYPIRVRQIGQDSQALNYDRWDICSAACTRGKRLDIRVYEFAREALIRKYGEEWFMELDAAAHR